MSKTPKDTKTGKEVKLTKETEKFLKECGFNNINETKIISLNNIYSYTDLEDKNNFLSGSNLLPTQSNSMPQPPLYWALIILAEFLKDKGKYTILLPDLIEELTIRIDYMRNIIINLIKAGANVNYKWEFVEKVIHGGQIVPPGGGQGQLHLTSSSRMRTIRTNLLEEFINNLVFNREAEILKLILQSNVDLNQTVTLSTSTVFLYYSDEKMLPYLEILAEIPNLNCVNYRFVGNLEWNLHGLQHQKKVNQLYELLTLRKNCQQTLLPIVDSDTPLMKLLRMGDLNQIDATLKRGTEKDGSPINFNDKNEKGETLTQLLHKVFPSVFFDTQGNLKLLEKAEFDKLNSATARLYPLVETIVTRNAKSVEQAATSLQKTMKEGAMKGYYAPEVLGLIGEHMDPDQISHAKTFFDPNTGKEKADRATAAMLKMPSSTPMPKPAQAKPQPKDKEPLGQPVAKAAPVATKPVHFKHKPTTGAGTVASRIRDIEKQKEDEEKAKAKAKKPGDKKK